MTMETTQKTRISTVLEWRRRHKQKRQLQNGGTLLSIRDLTVSYGPIRALDDIAFDVPKGKVISILGANGAGKSTLLKTISGLKEADKGQIIYGGETILNSNPESIADKGIIHAPEGRQVFTELSVYENLMIGAFTVKDDSVRRSTLMMDKLPEKTRKRIGTGDGDERVQLKRQEIIANNLARVYDMFSVLEERKDQIALKIGRAHV